MLHQINFRTIILFSLLTLLFLNLSSLAQDIELKKVVIYLKNGDIIKGETIWESIITIILKTTMGQINVSKKDIDRIEFDKIKIKVFLTDGTIISGILLSQTPQNIVIESNLGQLSINLTNILKTDPELTTFRNPLTDPKTLISPINREPVISEYEPTEKTNPRTPEGTQIYSHPFALSASLTKPFRSIEATSSYSDNGSWYLLNNFRERSNIKSSSASKPSFCINIEYLFSRTIGFELGFGGATSSISFDSSFAIDWTWYNGNGDSKDELWFGDGTLRTTPIFLNIVGYFGTQNIRGSVFAGYTLYFNKFQANAFMGMFLSYVDEYYIYGYKFTDQYVDGLKIPVNIDETWSSSGANIGCGLDLSLSDLISLNINCRYFYCPEKQFKWNYSLGTYDGLFGDYRWTVDRDIANSYEEVTSPFKVNPSFFQITCGIRIWF